MFIWKMMNRLILLTVAYAISISKIRDYFLIIFNIFYRLILVEVITSIISSLIKRCFWTFFFSSILYTSSLDLKNVAKKWPKQSHKMSHRSAIFLRSKIAKFVHLSGVGKEIVKIWSFHMPMPVMNDPPAKFMRILQRKLDLTFFDYA
jgi:hypothetical protein